MKHGFVGRKGKKSPSRKQQGRKPLGEKQHGKAQQGTPRKRTSDVKSVTFSKPQKRIGGTVRGDVYIGALRFRDGTRKRVAIKKFKTPLSDAEAKLLKKTIKDLVAAGVRLPKMAAVKLPSGEWVQVSQLFGSVRQRSKLAEGRLLKTMPEKIEAIREWTKVANAGYYIHADLIVPFKGDRSGAMPIDLDNVWKVKSLGTLTGQLCMHIHNLAEGNQQHARALMRAAMETANPEMKAALKAAAKKYPEWGAGI